MGLSELNFMFDTPDWPTLLRSAACVLLAFEVAAMLLSALPGRTWPAALSLTAAGLFTAPLVVLSAVFGHPFMVPASLLAGALAMACVGTFGLMTSVRGEPVRSSALLRSLLRGTTIVGLATAACCWPLQGAALAIGACAVFWMIRSYRRTTATLSDRKKAVLLALRILVVLLLTGSLVRPALEFHRMQAVPSVVLLGVDTSSSMNRKDASSTVAGKADPISRIAAVSEALKDNAYLLQTLTNQVEVDVFTFALTSRPQALLPQKSALAKAAPSHEIYELPNADGPGTAIGDATADAFAPYVAATRDVAAVILLTDGCNNTADTVEPDKQAELLAQRGVPVYTVGVGSDDVTKSTRTLSVKDLLAPDEVEAFNRLPITAAVETMGLEGKSVKVTCRFGDKEVGAETFTVASPHETHTSRFDYMPPAAGFHRLTVTTDVQGMAPEGLEHPPDPSKLVHVIDRELRILYIEGKFRYETKYIAQAMAAGRRFSIDRRILLQPLAAEQPSPLSEDPNDWLRYHAIVLGDVGASHFSANQLSIIKDLVSNRGKGLCMIGGANSFGCGGWAGTPLADVLPIDMAGSDRQLPGPVKVVLTDEGRRSEIMKINDDDTDPSRSWAELGKRKLDGANRLVNPKPGATVLARGEQNDPLIVCQNYGAGRSLAIAFDTTWRWVLSPDDDAETTGQLQRRFWRQVALYLAAPKGNVWIAADKTTYDYRRLLGGQETVEVAAGVEDASGLPAPEDMKSITLTDPRGQTTPLLLERTGEGFKGKLPPPNQSPIAGNGGSPGALAYTLKITAEVGGKPLAAEHKFEVVQPNLEGRDVLANFSLLRKLAAAGNGKFVTLDKFPDLLQDLVHDIKPKMVDMPEHMDLAGEFRWPLVTTLIVLLCLEWAFRKRKGLV